MIGSYAEGQLIKVAFHLYCVWIMRVRVGRCQWRKEKFGEEKGNEAIGEWGSGNAFTSRPRFF